jgi:RNA polymerase sigma-70 factor, ECF subfamily
MFSRRLNPEDDPTGGRNPPLAFRQSLEYARRGEAEGVSTLYRQFLPGVFGYIAARVPDRATAEDLTSEVFLQMVEGISRVRTQDEPQFAAWLFQIARVTLAGYYRKSKKLPTFVSLEPATISETTIENEVMLASSQETDPANHAEQSEEWDQVVQAMNMLTEEQRLVLVGRLILGYEVADVAKMIGKKANAVKALQFRALNSLHRLLRQNADIAYSHERQGRRTR